MQSIPTPASGAAIDGRITRTWQDDREEVLRHQCRKDIIRVIFPRRLLPILRARVR
jgi:hypothetical protein